MHFAIYHESLHFQISYSYFLKYERRSHVVKLEGSFHKSSNIWFPFPVKQIYVVEYLPDGSFGLLDCLEYILYLNSRLESMEQLFDSFAFMYFEGKKMKSIVFRYNVCKFDF